MSVEVEHGRVAGFDAIVLANRRIRATIIPALGGRVWELEDRARRRQWIWHRRDVPLAACQPGSAYDDVWAGGWEELFPNDAAGEFEGRTLFDHGEWWALPWTVSEIDARQGSVRLTATTSAPRAVCEKHISIAGDGATIEISYSIRSEELRPFHFLFKQHLPIAITPSCRIHLPGGQVRPVDPSFSTLLAPQDSFAWPAGRARSAGTTVDLRAVPPPSNEAREFVYVHDLAAGWCGVVDAGTQASLRMNFDARVLPYVWLFLSYGGWRDVYTAVLEPCTNMPKDLEAAVRAGQSARLDVRGEFRTTVRVTLGAEHEICG